MTGWSGDGAPGTGSLREFAIGAVTQHFTKRIAARRGHRLQAAEGAPVGCHGSVSALAWPERGLQPVQDHVPEHDDELNAGKNLFINGGSNPNFGGTCNFCHTNGGALSASLRNQNRNFNTNVEDRLHPARTQVQNFPKDGGFGQNNNGDGTFGNRTFNTASVVEAADTAPFFHNNVEAHTRDAVRFYTGPEFNNPRAPAARFSFNDRRSIRSPTSCAVSTRSRTSRSPGRSSTEILANQRDPRSEQNRRLQTAFDETQDGIDVLTAGNLLPGGRDHLIAARNFISQAQVTELRVSAGR